MKYTALFLGIHRETDKVECITGEFNTRETEYPKNCVKDIARLIRRLLEAKDFEDLEILDVCEIVSENGESLWNELTDKQLAKLQYDTEI